MVNDSIHDAGGGSYVHGASETPLLGLTVGQLFDHCVARNADREALVVVDQEIRWTWTELAGHVGRFAAGLQALGLEPGDRVGILAPNMAEWVVTQFATAKAGLILVNINPAYRTQELEFAVKQVGANSLGIRRSALDCQWRPRDGRRRGILPDRRAHQGHAGPWRREHLPT